MRVFRFRAALFTLGVTGMAAISACNQQPAAPAAPEGESAAPAQQGRVQIARDQVEHGRLLIIGGGCHDCHSPKTMTQTGPVVDESRILSGHPESAGVTPPFKGQGGPYSTHTNDHLTAWSGAWGVSYAANITPDENTGIGIWTEDMFLRAMKEGKHMGTSRPILPPMPWNFIGQLPDEDLKAMFAYLKSIPAISNRVPVPLTPDGKPIEDAAGGAD
jgi:hypothetical protein